MFKRNIIAPMLSLLPICAFAQPANCTSPGYRPLAPESVKKALALADPNCETTVPPFVKPGLPLPAGVTIESEGYSCFNYDGELLYSFVQAHTPAGKEILFVCQNAPVAPPDWRWATEPTACAVALVDRPATRAAQVDEATRLTTRLDARKGIDSRTSSEGWDYYRQVKLQFEPIMRRCAKEQAVDERRYAWMGRISLKGAVSRTGVIAGSGGPPERAYSDCINGGMRALNLPTPPMGSGAAYLSGGWPITIWWEHAAAGDRIVAD